MAAANARLIAAAPEQRVVGERLAYQASAIRGALIACGHSGALKFFEETLRLNDAAIAKAENSSGQTKSLYVAHFGDPLKCAKSAIAKAEK